MRRLLSTLKVVFLLGTVFILVSIFSLLERGKRSGDTLYEKIFGSKDVRADAPACGSCGGGSCGGCGCGDGGGGGGGSSS